jgi:hypothetical protein
MALLRTCVLIASVTLFLGLFIRGLRDKEESPGDPVFHLALALFATGLLLS